MVFLSAVSLPLRCSALLRSTSQHHTHVSHHTTQIIANPRDIFPRAQEGYFDILRSVNAEEDRIRQEHIRPLKEQTAVDFRSVKCELPVPASKEQCLHAAEAVRLAFDGISEDYRLKLDPVKKLLERVEALSLPLLREVRTDYFS